MANVKLLKQYKCLVFCSFYVALSRRSWNGVAFWTTR